MTLQTTKCEHQKLYAQFDDDGNNMSTDDFNNKWYQDKNQIKCGECNKTLEEMYLDEYDIDPTVKTSQQPHSGRTLYCNACQMYVKPTRWDGEEVCPYHQRVRRTEEGTEFMYDEFNEDGDEW